MGRRNVALSSLALLCACTSSADGPANGTGASPGSGASPGTGGLASGGGGAATGGSSTGGAPGGAASGGEGTGSTATGGAATGLPSSDPLDCGGFNGTPIADHCTTDFGGYDYGHALAADPAAWAAFDIMGTHQYDSQVAYPWPDDAPARGDKEVWQTEMSGVKWWPEQGVINGTTVTSTTHIQNGVAVARWIHSGLVVGEANAWLYWWYTALGTDDNEGLLTNNDVIAQRYYTFGQFSKFVRPGYHRVVMTGDLPDKVLVSAYKSDEGAAVVVAINETTTAQSIPITFSGGTAPAAVTPYRTSDTEDIATLAAVPVAGSKFTAELPAMTVTTFVSQ